MPEVQLLVLDSSVTGVHRRTELVFLGVRASGGKLTWLVKLSDSWVCLSEATAEYIQVNGSVHVGFPPGHAEASALPREV